MYILFWWDPKETHVIYGREGERGNLTQTKIV